MRDMPSDNDTAGLNIKVLSEIAKYMVNDQIRDKWHNKL